MITVLKALLKWKKEAVEVLKPTTNKLLSDEELWTSVGGKKREDKLILILTLYLYIYIQHIFIQNSVKCYICVATRHVSRGFQNLCASVRKRV